jgi:hypothetical protein
MNQTKKRLSIINLAISITDIETIQLQILKLGLLKTDTKIQEIIAVLQAENYAKAQRLIKVYIDTPMAEILQRSSQQKSPDIENFTSSNKKETIISKEDQKIIDEFQLFTTETENSPRPVTKKEININDYLTDTPVIPNEKEDKQAANFDALLNMGVDDVMPNNIELDISEDTNDSFFDPPVKREKTSVNTVTENVSRDTFFDLNKDEERDVEKIPSKDPFETLLTVKTDKKASLIRDALKKQAATEQAIQKQSVPKKVAPKTPIEKNETIPKFQEKEVVSPKQKVKQIPESYPPISYIRQKFVSMKKQYEPIQKSNDRFPAVETFLTTISQDGYKEKEIIQTLTYVEKLIAEQKFAEAAQLLLVSASTESKFAQFMLARELYRGILLRKKVSEAFSILTHLADEKYPEALCDLGQFYENAISTGRDKKIAKELYKQAMDLGIKRAQKHYARLEKQTKGFFKK